MQRDPDRADAPSRWMSNARTDLALAGIPLPPGAAYEQLCFHAQQAAEKSMKAVLLELGIEFPFTHNLQVLSELLPPQVYRSNVLDNAPDLNPYAVTTRYPGESEPITEQEHRDALRIARDVVEWAEGVIGGS